MHPRGTRCHRSIQKWFGTWDSLALFIVDILKSVSNSIKGYVSLKWIWTIVGGHIHVSELADHETAAFKNQSMEIDHKNLGPSLQVAPYFSRVTLLKLHCLCKMIDSYICIYVSIYIYVHVILIYNICINSWTFQRVPKRVPLQGVNSPCLKV